MPDQPDETEIGDGETESYAQHILDIIPGDIRYILRCYINKERLPKTETRKMINWIIENYDKIGNLKMLVYALGGDDKAYERLKKLVRWHRKRMTDMEAVAKQLMEEELHDRTEKGAVNMAVAIHQIASNVVAEYWDYPNRLPGYGSTIEDKERFFRDAVEFYVENYFLPDELKRYKALVRVLAAIAKPEILKYAATRVLRDIALAMIKLKAAGYPIDEGFEQRVILATEKALEELISRECVKAGERNGRK